MLSTTAGGTPSRTRHARAWSDDVNFPAPISPDLVVPECQCRQTKPRGSDEFCSSCCQRCRGVRSWPITLRKGVAFNRAMPPRKCDSTQHVMRGNYKAEGDLSK